MMNYRRVYFALFLLLFATSFRASTSEAHEADMGSVVVSHPYILPAEKGTDTVLRMRLDNTGATAIQVIGLQTSIAEEALIEGDIGEKRVAIFNSVSIKPGEYLQFDHALWIRLKGLRREVQFGQMVQASLLLAGGDLSIDVKVGNFD